MTDPEIKRLAREAGIWLFEDAPHVEATTGTLRVFAAAVEAHALERAAKVCDATPPYQFRPSIEAAHAIRALLSEGN